MLPALHKSMCMYNRITLHQRGACKPRGSNCCTVRADSSDLGRRLLRDSRTCAVSMIPVEGLSPVYREGQDTGRVLLIPPPPRAQPQACMMAPRTPSLVTQLMAGGTYSAHTKRHLAMSAWKRSRFLLDRLSVQTQDTFSPGLIRRRSGINGIIHVPKTACTLELFLWQRPGLTLLSASSPSHFSICTYSTSREVHRTSVNINNGNIKALFQVQDCKWYLSLLLSTYLFIKCIRKSIKEEIKDLMTCTII